VHTSADRLTEFDNANFHFGWVRLDQCLAGLPQSIELVSSADETAPAASASEASALLGRWLEAAREQPSAAPCFNATGFPLDLSGRFDDTLLVAPEYKLSFQTAAKVASMTAVAWMQCRFGATSATAEAAAPPAYPGYTRLAMVREPASRAISGYMQTASHYLQLLRLPPAGLRSCAAAWPAGLESISLDASLRDASTGAPPNGTSTWPRECHEAWATDAFTGAPKGDREPIIYLTQSELRATAGSSFLQALWELPAACRTISRPNGDLRRQWFCEGDECDVSTPCELPDATMVALLAHALSDAARTNMGGCAPMTFGGEHLWPQLLHLAPSGRVDAVFRLESVEADSARFEAHLAEALGVASLPAAQLGCSWEALHTNDDSTHGLAAGLDDEARLRALVYRSADLQRRLCALYYHDFVCGGYALLDACQAPAAEWLDAALADLLADAPLAPLEDASGAKSDAEREDE